MRILLITAHNACAVSLVAVLERFAKLSVISSSNLDDAKSDKDSIDKIIIWSAGQAVDGIALAIRLRSPQFSFDGPVIVGCISTEDIKKIPERILSSGWIEDLGIEIQPASRILGRVLEDHSLEPTSFSRACRPVWSLIVERPTLLHDFNSSLRELAKLVRDLDGALPDELEIKQDLLRRLNASQSELQGYNRLLREMWSFD